MKLVVIIVVMLFNSPCFAWENPAPRDVPFAGVPKDSTSTIALEARRVKSISGNTMTYDTGKGDITIRADSFASQRFLKDVERGRTSARQNVTLEPLRKSPFNTQFKTSN